MQTDEAPVVTVVGRLVALGPLHQDLMRLHQRWLNDLEVSRTFRSHLLPVTREARDAWFDRYGRGDDRSVVDFAVYERATWRPIGFTSLEDLDYVHGTGRFVLAIGERECWGRGYGTETTRLMLDYGFNALGLHNILLTVISDNERGIRAYTRAGFKVIGARRGALRFAGRRYDHIYMDATADDFDSPMLAQLLQERG